MKRERERTIYKFKAREERDRNIDKMKNIGSREKDKKKEERKIDKM